MHYTISINFHTFCLVSLCVGALTFEEHLGGSEEELGGDIPAVEGFGDPVTIPEEDSVLVLNHDNFDHVVGLRELILVEFYAPWCGHCKALVPEYAEAAKQLQEEGIPLGKVDATVETELGNMFEIKSYPSLKLFKKGQFAEEFDGARTSTGIIEYMRKHADPNYQPPPSEVIDLTSDTFDEFVITNDLSLVEFFAPWCGHCKVLAPEYEAAAKDLKLFGIPLAKVDSTVEKDLVSKYGVTGYPKLFLFRKGRQFEFKGPRTRVGIVDYMKQQTELPSTEIKSLQRAINEISRTDVTIFSYFNDALSQNFEEYITAANTMRGECTFIHTFDPELSKEFSLKVNSVNVLHPKIYQSKYEPKRSTYGKEDITSENLVEFIRKNSNPLIGHRTMENMNLKFAQRPIVVIYYDVNFDHQYVKDTLYIRNKLLSIADSNRDLLFAMSNEEEFKDELKDLGLDDSGEDVNIAIFGKNQEKYAMEPDDDFDEELSEFIEKFKSGRLRAYLKSQPIPKRQDGPVRVIVGNSFRKEVENSTKDVLIEFYAPWCGHCKELEPVFNKVAKHFSKTRNDIVVAKMDATANDIPQPFEVKGFPTIVFVRSSDKERILFEGGERTFKALRDFVLDNISNVKDEL